MIFKTIIIEKVKKIVLIYFLNVIFSIRICVYTKYITNRPNMLVPGKISCAATTFLRYFAGT